MKKIKENNLKQRNLIKIIVLLLLAVIFFTFIRKEEPVSEVETISLLDAAKEVQIDGKKQEIAEITVTEDGTYGDAEHVALYLHLYGHLPSNYITKTQAKKKGWIQEEGNLWDVLPGMSIGGGDFQNYEGKLPEKEGREYRECDVNYKGGARGDDRIVYSNDGLIYYTSDHYNEFKLIYGEP